MSFSSGNSGTQSEINVTPLIDVLLVLLIIFMVIVPMKPNGLKAAVPQPTPSSATPPPPDPTTVVVQVHANSSGAPTYTLNLQPIAKDAIVARLREIYAMRQEKTMFVKGDAELEFSSIAEVIGMGRQALVDNIGVLTPKMEVGR